ncbi:MAG: fumarylacetoacetate hydrolase family protein [Desulfarculaceae bacterium]|jgi:2-keto-4-pentenoate hydratase/2-oxohepta-3-ene-1,7-dioic acid hydratase in catechol pathway
MAIFKKLVQAKKAVVRVVHKGKVRYGLWQGGRIRAYEGSPFSGGKPGKQYIPLKEADLLAPCRPSKIVAVGLNYKSHAKEMKKALPKEPMVFLKPSTSVIGPGAPIVRPQGATRVDYEAELAIVIGKRCRLVKEDDALDYVFGYTCLNDVTERHLQAKDIQYTRAKGFDTFCPLGPAIALELNPARLNVRSIVNGQVRQKGNTSDLIFSVAQLVSFISQVMTLHPGDVIASGTPEGVGPLVAGDTVGIEVQGIGSLINPIVDAP